MEPQLGLKDERRYGVLPYPRAAERRHRHVLQRGVNTPLFRGDFRAYYGLMACASNLIIIDPQRA